jgi:predicted O-methyltransferase YrrM
MAVRPLELDFPTQVLRTAAANSQSRTELWISIIQSLGVQRMAEIGVYRGDFAAEILRACESLKTYYMIDPWRHLSDWNKPANHENATLQQFFQETKAKTDFADSKRVILRGKTVEVMDQIADGALDFAYVDADHTLKGITIDLIRVYPKIRAGGFLGGDDFTRSVWEHKTKFEPTLVFPFAVYFAEAVGATIYALPYSQFCIHKGNGEQFSFVDLTGQYDDIGLKNQFTPEKLLKLTVAERFPRAMRAARRVRSALRRPYKPA